MKEKTYRIKLKDYIILLCCIVCLFQNSLIKLNSIFSYFDEIIAIFFIIVCLIKWLISKKIYKYDFKILICIIILSILGSFGTFYASIQINILVILQDAFNVFRVFFVYLGANYFLDKSVNKKFIICKLAFLVKILVTISTFCAILSLFKDIGMSEGEIRYGIKSFSFIFSNPGTYAMYIYMYILILTIDLNYEKNKIFIFFAIVSWIATLRTRGFLFIILYFISYFFIFSKKDNIKFKLKIRYIILVLALAIPIMHNKIIYYFGEFSETARNSFLRNSFKVAKMYFPFGSGFATFGTSIASKYYSPLYYILQMNEIFGLGEGDNNFANDNYWPAILGEFGIFGILIMGMLLFFLFKKMFDISKKNKFNFLGTIFVAIVTLGSSIATATFFHYTTAALFLIVGLMDNSNEYER